MSAPADPGLQPERTALAWRRTSLALIGLSLGSARVTWPVIGRRPAGAGSALGVWLVLRGGSRYARHSTAVASGEGAGTAGSALASLLTMAIAVAGIVSVVVGHH
jgi:putative membrane protein